MQEERMCAVGFQILWNLKAPEGLLTRETDAPYVYSELTGWAAAQLYPTLLQSCWPAQKLPYNSSSADKAHWLRTCSSEDDSEVKKAGRRPMTGWPWLRLVSGTHSFLFQHRALHFKSYTSLTL